jgi:ATP-dependent DNA helicase RecG
MTIAELKHTLNSLCNLTAENEIVEFKEAKTGYDFTKLGNTFLLSATRPI